MNTPKVSIITPTYNGGEFLGEAIQSVLRQTYTNFEYIIINDASPDRTTEIVEQYDDPRLQYIVHKENRGADRARYTGLQASTGEIIFFLDQDDYFHPEKLQAHVAFLEKNPEIGFSYNARFELNYSSTTIRDLWRPSSNITLEDLALSFPLSPSDTVLRRNWAFEMDFLGSRRGAEITHYGRLFLAGCKFGFVDRALNYRRYHLGRIVKNISKACEFEIDNQVQIFSDPRFPSELIALRDIAHANLYVYWAFMAFSQAETELGQNLLQHAIRLKPSIVEGSPCELMSQFLINCIDNDALDHETLIRRILDQLPSEAFLLLDQYSWAIAEGHILKGARAVIWGRIEDGNRHFNNAANVDAHIDEYFLNALTHKLLDYEVEFGSEAAQSVLRNIESFLRKLPDVNVRSMFGSYYVNRAFQYFHEGEYAHAKRMLVHAIGNDPKYVTNRGVLSVFFRSLLRS